MKDEIWNDLAEMKKKLGEYIDKGRAVGFHGIRLEPVIAVKPDRSKIKPLKKVDNYAGQFVAVDCSTRTLKRANNWEFTSCEQRMLLWKGTTYFGVMKRALPA